MNHPIRQLISRPLLQPLWKLLLNASHAGMNYGGGQGVESSGEIAAFRFALKRLSAISPDRPRIVLDVGANLGEYAAVISGELEAGDRIYSCEPQRSSFEKLAERFAGCPNIFCRPVALGREEGDARLYFEAEEAATASLHRPRAAAAATAPGGSETVVLTTVDLFCSREGLSRIDFLKIDTEGHEMDVLLGAGEMIGSGRIACIQFEFGETFLQGGYYFKDLFELLSPRYEIHRILRHGLAPIGSYSCGLEIFKIANFLCLRK